MTEILNPKVTTSGLTELVLTGVVKQFEEKMTSPMIGNATLMSGGVKLVGGYLANGMIGQKPYLRTVSNALIIDAGEDFAMGIMSFLGGAGIGSRANAGW